MNLYNVAIFPVQESLVMMDSPVSEDLEVVRVMRDQSDLQDYLVCQV